MSEIITCDNYRRTKKTIQTVFEIITCDYYQKPKYFIQTMFEIT